MSRSILSTRVQGVPASQIRAIHDARRPTSLNLGLGQPSLEVDPRLIDGGRALMKSSGYTANAGLPELRAAIAAHHALPGCLSADDVVITCGSQEAILASMAACLDVGDDVLLAEPAFPGYRMAALFLGANCIGVPRDPARNFRLDAKAVERALTPRTRVVVINSPSNPTGAVDEEAEVAALARLADERGFVILSDEIYSDLFYGVGSVPSAGRHGANVIVVSGLSKNCAMTGFRIGYTISRKEITAGILRAHSLATTCAPSLSQHMALFVFQNPEWLRAHLPFYRQRRSNALDALSGLPVRVIEPEGAFYVFLDLGTHTDDAFAFAKAFLDVEDVITTPGTAFGSTTRSWLRLSYAGDPATFTEGVARLGRFLKNGNKKPS